VTLLILVVVRVLQCCGIPEGVTSFMPAPFRSG
jgi:hypothetical protein